MCAHLSAVTCRACVLTGDLGEGVEGDRRHAELVHRPNHSKGVQRKRLHRRRQGERSAASGLVPGGVTLNTRLRAEMPAGPGVSV